MGSDKAADDWDRMKTNKFALNKIPHWNETDSLFSHSLFVSDCIIMNCDVMESMNVNNRYKRDHILTNDWAITIQFITIVRTFVDLPDLLCVRTNALELLQLDSTPVHSYSSLFSHKHTRTVLFPLPLFPAHSIHSHSKWSNCAINSVVSAHNIFHAAMKCSRKTLIFGFGVNDMAMQM